MYFLQLNIKPETGEHLQKILDDMEDQETLAQNVIAWHISERRKNRPFF